MTPVIHIKDVHSNVYEKSLITPTRKRQRFMYRNNSGILIFCLHAFNMFHRYRITKHSWWWH